MPTDWTAWNQGSGNSNSNSRPFATSWTQDINWSPTRTEGNRWGSAASGAASGASTGATVSGGNPYATAGGAIIGGIGGFISGGPKDISEPEQLANNWSALGNAGLKQFGGQAIEGQFNAIGDYMEGIQDFRNMGPPDTSGAQAASNNIGQAAGKLMNYKPERIDADRAMWDRVMEGGMGQVVAPQFLAANQQAQEGRKQIAANPFLSGQQKQEMMNSGQRALAQGNAMTQSQLISQGLTQKGQLGAQGDSLVMQAMSNAGRLFASQAQFELAISKVPYEYQYMAMQLLAKAPAMFQDFLAQFNPDQNQYNAAMAGGRDENKFLSGMNAINQGAQAWKGSTTPTSPGQPTSADYARWDAASP